MKQCMQIEFVQEFLANSRPGDVIQPDAVYDDSLRLLLIDDHCTDRHPMICTLELLYNFQQCPAQTPHD